MITCCLTSVSHTRNLLYNILDEMHRSYERVEVNSWVDDCPHVHVGDEEVLQKHAPEVAKAFVARLRLRGFSISLKSTLVGSNQQITAFVQK